jgi:phage shock protein A
MTREDLKQRLQASADPLAKEALAAIETLEGALALSHHHFDQVADTAMRLREELNALRVE